MRVASRGPGRPAPTARRAGRPGATKQTRACLLHADDAKPASSPYGDPPEERPGIRLSAVMDRLYEKHSARWTAAKQLHSKFKYTRLDGLDYGGHDSTFSAAI